MAKDEIQYRIGVQDDATSAMERIGGEADQLDSRLDGLTKEDREIVLRADVSNAERELKRATRQVEAAVREGDGERIRIAIEARNTASADLDRVQGELRALDGDDARVDVVADTGQAESKLDGIRQKLEGLTDSAGDFGGALGGIGGVGKAGGIGAVVAGMFAAANHAKDAAIAADDLSKLTGDSVEEASRLQAVWQTTGADAKDLQDVLLQMGGVLETDAELAEQLGVNLSDGATLGERFEQVVEILRDKYPDAAQRSIVSARLFGEEGVRQVNALTSQYADLSTAIADVNDANVFDDSDVEKAREFHAQWEGVKLQLQGAVVSLGEFAGQDLSNLIAGASELAGYIDAIRGDGASPLGDDTVGGFLGLLPEYNTESAKAKFATEAMTIAVGELQTSFAEAAAEAVHLTEDQRAQAEGLRAAGRAEAEYAEEQAERAAERKEAHEDWVDDINDGIDLQVKRSEKFAEAAAKEQEALDAQQAAYEEWRSGIESSFQSGAESVGSFSIEAGTSLDDFRADLLTQVAEMREWKDNLAIIAEEAGEDVAAFLAEQGQAGAGFVDEIAQGIEDGTPDVENNIGVIQAYLDEIGDGTPAEIGKNLEDLSPEVAKAIEDAGKAGAKEAETARGKVRDEFAKLPNDASSATSGIDDAVRANVSAAGGAAYGAAVGVGDQMASGMESGVAAAAGRVARAAASLVEGAIQRAREAAEIFSPSRRFAKEVGEPIAEGVAQGIEDGADQVGAAGAAAIGAAAVTMTEAAERSAAPVAQGWLKRFSEWFHDNGQSSMADAIREGIRGTRDAAVEQAEKVAEKAAEAYERIWDRIDFKSLLERQRRSIGDAEDALADVFERRRDARADRRAGIVSARGGVADARGRAAEQRAEDTAAIREQRQENRAAVNDAKKSLNEAVQARKAAARELAKAEKADADADRKQAKSVADAEQALADATNATYATQRLRNEALVQAQRDLAEAEKVDEDAEKDRQKRIASAQKDFDRAADVVGKARESLAGEQADAAEALQRLLDQRAANAEANKQRIADARQELADAKAVLLDDDAFQKDIAEAKRRIREAKEDLARSMLDAEGVLKGDDRREFRRLMRQAGFSDAQIDRLLRADARQVNTAANVGDVRDAATAQMLAELKEFNKVMREGPAWMRVAVIDEPQFRKYLDAEMRKWLDEARRKKGKG